jgi:hypothetical protein
MMMGLHNLNANNINIVSVMKIPVCMDVDTAVVGSSKVLWHGLPKEVFGQAHNVMHLHL